jgi:hypothetical protein
VVIPKEELNETSKEELDKTSKEKLDETSKEEIIEMSEKDESVQTRPMNEPTNQTKSSERQNKVFAKTPIGPCLTPQILKMTTTTESKINAPNPCPQASNDDPPPGLPTPAQSPEPQPNIATASANREPRFEHVPEKGARPRQEVRGDTDNKLATSCQGIPACRYAVTTTDTMTDAFPTDTDPFAYNTTSHYTSKRSTAGHNQFLAFQRLDTGVQLSTTIQGIG